MNEIIDIASRLGKAIAESAQARKLREARDALQAEPATLQVLQDYHSQTDKIAALEAEAKPVEVADKHRLQELHDKLIAADVFKKYTAAQVDYVDLMRQVNDTLRRQLGETEGETRAG